MWSHFFLASFSSLDVHTKTAPNEDSAFVYLAASVKSSAISVSWLVIPSVFRSDIVTITSLDKVFNLRASIPGNAP